MDKYLFTIISTFLSFQISGQIFVTQPKDSTYLERIDGEFDDLWRFRSDLLQGKYWLIDITECGADTLAYAEFKSDGIKDGIWFENFSKECFFYSNRKNSKKGIWKFDWDKNTRLSETIYNSGSIVRSILFHEPDQPYIERIYPENCQDFNEWNLMKIWSTSGQLTMKSTLLESGEFSVEEYFTSESLIAKGMKDEQDWRIGKWEIWNDSNELIAELIFENGLLTNRKIYQEMELPSWAQQN